MGLFSFPGRFALFTEGEEAFLEVFGLDEFEEFGVEVFMGKAAQLVVSSDAPLVGQGGAFPQLDNELVRSRIYFLRCIYQVCNNPPGGELDCCPSLCQQAPGEGHTGRHKSR
jgi:hypothetical protein